MTGGSRVTSGMMDGMKRFINESSLSAKTYAAVIQSQQRVTTEYHDNRAFHDGQRCGTHLSKQPGKARKATLMLFSIS